MYRLISFRVALITLMLFALPLLGQPRPRGVDGFRSEIRLQGFHFGNFFQATDSALEEDVRASGLEYRGAWRPQNSPTDFYGHASYLNYSGLDRKDSYAARLGLAHFGRVHEFNAFADRAENRASFDVGDTTALANVTTFAANYGFRITPDWQLGAEGIHERQRFNIATGRENEYNAFGGSVRYRGFGRMFSPEVGFLRGNRDVRDERESYDEKTWYARAIMNPTSRVYMSVRYRDRTRDYRVTDPSAGNFGRSDDRGQWTVNLVYQFTDRVGASLYYSQEDVISTRAGRDFDTDFFVVSLNYGF
jgi:hypothetical protein